MREKIAEQLNLYVDLQTHGIHAIYNPIQTFDQQTQKITTFGKTIYEETSLKFFPPIDDIAKVELMLDKNPRSHKLLTLRDKLMYNYRTWGTDDLHIQKKIRLHSQIILNDKMQGLRMSILELTRIFLVSEMQKDNIPEITLPRAFEQAVTLLLTLGVLHMKPSGYYSAVKSKEMEFGMQKITEKRQLSKQEEES